jgi:hypothetical protein
VGGRHPDDRAGVGARRDDHGAGRMTMMRLLAFIAMGLVLASSVALAQATTNESVSTLPTTTPATAPGLPEDSAE